jgi:hypothetical protein
MMKYLHPLLLLFGALACLPDRTNAQFIQQGDKLVGAGAVGNAQQGTNVSLSADGNTAIIGGYRDQPRFSFIDGAAWIFTRSAGIWSQQGSKLVGTGASGSSYLGYSVSLSLDGNTALLSGHGDSNLVGAAWVFIRTGSVWSQQGPKLVGTGALGGSTQGYCVALSGDGNTAIVGGPFDSANTGAVWVFTRTDTVWSQQGNKLVGTGALGGAFQGASVALSSDGNTAIVGGPLDSMNSRGATWLFTRTAGVWSQQGGKLVGTGGDGGSRQGSSVSLSADGNTALVGGIGDNNGTGALWVFTRSGVVWRQQGTKLVGTGAVHGTYGSEQGYCVSLSGDGNTALEGAYADNNNAGAAWVFKRNDSLWTQQGDKLVGAGAVGNAWQGYGLALSSDGRTFIMGGNMDNGLRGAAWVFADASPLPIQLSSIKALATPRCCVQIEWTTLSEIHNYGFEVQRRPEGESIFADLAGSFESGRGTTNYPQKYAYADTSVAPGTWFYRVKQIDLDGTVHFTDAVRVEVAAGDADGPVPGSYSVGQNFPNPFNPTTRINYGVPTLSHIVLRVVDILGRDIATLVDGVEGPGNKSVPFDGSRLASGMYFYRLHATAVGDSRAGDFIQTRKMILSK